jgi:hypothetical protein
MRSMFSVRVSKLIVVHLLLFLLYKECTSLTTIKDPPKFVCQVPSSFPRARSWMAAEEWLTPQEFSSLLNGSPYNVMVGCESWRVSFPFNFLLI